MTVVFTDAEIAAFLNEPKILPDDYYEVLINQLKPRGPSKRSTLPVHGAHDNSFHIDIRQAVHNSRDFSVILRVEQRIVTGSFILRRYNGASHWHTNVLEGDSFRDYHIHIATERYQEENRKPEHFAEVTKSYSDVVTALECMINDCNFIRPSESRERLI